MENLGTILDYELFQLSGRSVTVGTLAFAGLILAGTYLTSFLMRKAIERWFGPKDKLQQGAQKAVLRLLHYVILLIGLGLAMETVGFSFTTLLATGAIFAVGIGFALQNVVQNFVSGIILLFERSIKPNDVLELDGSIVRVMRMGIRSTVAKTLDDEELIIPNSILAQTMVKNYTMGDPIHRVRAPVGVTYDSDMAKVARVLEQSTRQLHWTVPGREPIVLMTGFGDNAVNFEVSVWIDTPWRRNQRLSDLNIAIWGALKEAEIVIAFPQVDVHFDKPINEGLRLIVEKPSPQVSGESKAV